MDWCLRWCCEASGMSLFWAECGGSPQKGLKEKNRVGSFSLELWCVILLSTCRDVTVMNAPHTLSTHCILKKNSRNLTVIFTIRLITLWNVELSYFRLVIVLVRRWVHKLFFLLWYSVTMLTSCQVPHNIRRKSQKFIPLSIREVGCALFSSSSKLDLFGFTYSEKTRANLAFEKRVYWERERE